jgi:hypothetical protein
MQKKLYWSDFEKESMQLNYDFKSIVIFKLNPTYQIHYYLVKQ